MLRNVGKDRMARAWKTFARLKHVNFISPENLYVVLSAVKNLCNSEKGETMRECEKYELPSLALKLGHSLKKKLAQIKIGQTLRKIGEVGLKEATNYLKLHDNEYGERISSQALNTFAERKFLNFLFISGSKCPYNLWWTAHFYYRGWRNPNLWISNEYLYSVFHKRGRFPLKVLHSGFVQVWQLKFICDKMPLVHSSSGLCPFSVDSLCLLYPCLFVSSSLFIIGR